IAVLAREEVTGGLEFPVFRLTDRAEGEQTEGRIRIDCVGVRSVAVKISRLEEETAGESLVPGDSLHDALRGLQRTVDDMRERDRAAELPAVCCKSAHRLHVVLRE